MQENEERICEGQGSLRWISGDGCCGGSDWLVGGINGGME